MHPAQKFLTDPQRGRQFRPMANRWISCLKEAPVSQHREHVLTFRFSLGQVKEVCALDAMEMIHVADPASNELQLYPGDYLITFQ